MSTKISCSEKETTTTEEKMVSMSNGCDNEPMANGNTGGSGAGANSASSKLSKIGRRIRDSCRHLRGKHPSGGACSQPEDYGSLQAPNVSCLFSIKLLKVIDWPSFLGKCTIPALCPYGLF